MTVVTACGIRSDAYNEQSQNGAHGKDGLVARVKGATGP